MGRLRSDIAAADTVTGKFKAGIKGTGDMLKQNAAPAAMAVGSALVAFGAKAVSAYQDAALAAGEFADATGVSVEQASRLIEVAGDVGVKADPNGVVQSLKQYERINGTRWRRR